MPSLCKYIIMIDFVEVLVYSTFWTSFVMELFRHISTESYAVSDIYYSLLGMTLSSFIIKYKDGIISRFKLFLVLDILMQTIFGIIFIVNKNYEFYWLFGCTICPALIQKFINVGIMRINYEACPDDRVKEDVNLLTDICNNIGRIIGGFLCIILSTLNLFNPSIWMIMIIIGTTLSSYFYFNIDHLKK